LAEAIVRALLSEHAAGKYYRVIVKEGVSPGGIRQMIVRSF
jgi:hypothetical protein